MIPFAPDFGCKFIILPVVLFVMVKWPVLLKILESPLLSWYKERSFPVPTTNLPRSGTLTFPSSNIASDSSPTLLHKNNISPVVDAAPVRPCICAVVLLLLMNYIVPIII